MPTKLTVYIDVESPYSYIAFELVLRHRELWGVELDFVPCHIGAVFKAAGNIAPAHAGPSKGKYASLDLLRSARLRGVPLRSMPVNSRAVRNAQEPFFQSGPALRMLTAVRAAGVRVALIAGPNSATYLRLIRACYRCTFVDHGGRPVEFSEDVLRQLVRCDMQHGCGSERMCLALLRRNSLREANRTAGLDAVAAHAAVQSASEDSAKQALRRQTQEAIEAGAFGLPFMLLQGEGVPPDCEKWFGSDRLEQIAVALGKPWSGSAAAASKL